MGSVLVLIIAITSTPMKVPGTGIYSEINEYIFVLACGLNRNIVFSYEFFSS